MGYTFTVLGGNFGDTVPVAIRYSLTAQFEGDYGGAEARINIAGAHTERVCAGNGCGTDPSAATRTYHFNAIAGQSYLISLSVRVSATTQYAPQENSGTAIVDPYIYIDPSFLYADQYAIGVEPGFDNSPGGEVPEPDTFYGVLAVFVAGLLHRFRLVRQAAK
jgi:hypothetical protein